MLLVIIGHVISQRTFALNAGFDIIYKWIYIFHMPLFVFISGYFSSKKDTESYIKSSWSLLEPLLLSQFFICTLNYFVNGTITLKEVFTPWWILWYLLSLFYWRTILQLIPNVVLNYKKTVLFVMFTVSIIAGFTPFDRFLSIQRTLSFMPFFFLGYFLKGHDLFVLSKHKLWCIFFLMISMFLPYCCSEYLGNLYHAQPYDKAVEAFSRILAFILSVPLSIAFLNACPNGSWSACQGKFTMPYYIYHGFIIYFFMIIVDKLSLPTSFIAVLIYCAAFIFILGVMSYFPFFRKALNPLSFFKGR